MKESEAKKIDVLVRLEKGADPRELARDLKIPYPKIMEWLTEYNKNKSSFDILDILKVDKVLIEKVAKELKEDYEITTNFENQEIADIVDNSVAKIDNLKLLNTQTQNSAILLVKRISDLALYIEQPHELVKLTIALANLHDTFFNPNITNVNVLSQTQINSADFQFGKILKD